MVKAWGAKWLLMACGTMVAAHARAQTMNDPTPLLPHPSNRFQQRPVYSQDRYKRDREADEQAGETMPPEAEPNIYSQDKFQSLETTEDYSDQLRKVPDKGREWSEVEIAKGIMQLNASELDKAMPHFKKALDHDPRNFVAIEYMSAIAERRGNYTEAISFLAKAKHIAPKGRWGQINFQIGRLYLLARNYERSEIYLRLALDQGGQLTAINYTLGYLLYLKERYFEAHRYLHEARMRATRPTALPNERQMLQAINYYLGEIYARLGFAQYAVLALRATEVGDSWEVRQGAWRVHSELNKMMWYATVGTFGQYDSNVVLVPVGGALPVEFTSQDSLAAVVTANGGWQTSPAKKWVAGVDAALYLNYHLNTSLFRFDVFNYALDGWVSYWNQKDWSFTGRIDYNDALTRGSFSSESHENRGFSRFQNATALTASANYFPFQRWNWEGGFQYRMNNFTTDEPTGPDRRTGKTFVGFLRASLKAPNPRLRPTLGYTFELDSTDGQNFQARSHIFLGELTYRLWERTHLSAALTYMRSSYPNHIQGRTDKIIQARMGLSHIFTEHWVGLFDITQIEDASSLTDFSYKRTVVTGGVTYTF